MIPPKPKSRAVNVSLWRYLRLFRQDILSAQPEKLYRAKMAEFKTPFFSSYFLNQPDLIDAVLTQRPLDFPKSDRVGAGLSLLLGKSVFLTNGSEWQRQRRIINPAFEGGRLRDTYVPMLSAGQDMVARLRDQQGPIDIERMASFSTADVIFRTLFSVPINDRLATEVFQAFQEFQRNQPILNIAAFVPVPKWFPRFHRRQSVTSARTIRTLITQLTLDRQDAIENGTAPNDLATKIMTQPDPETGELLPPDEMVDQVAIFFLAGHETSAAALGWALYLLALYPDIQDRVLTEVKILPEHPDLDDLKQLELTGHVFKETLRLYPPVPMMVRESTQTEMFRDRTLSKGSQIVISPWHLHRNPDHWTDPDAFDPDRHRADRRDATARQAYLPFSAGARKCPGAGFANIEGVLFLALLVRAFRFEIVPDRHPVPRAYLTVRSANGVWLNARPR